MGLFKRLKEKWQIKKSVQTFQDKTNSFKSLNSSEISNISDDDLSLAVMSWIWGLLDERDNYEIILDLPHPCQFVYSCRTITDEIYNGGFNQLYFNSTAMFAKIAEEGFSTIGAEKLAALMKQANDIYEKVKPQLEKYDDDTVESFSKSYEENLFNDLDALFYDEIESCGFDNLLVFYIRKTADCFGNR